MTDNKNMDRRRFLASARNLIEGGVSAGILGGGCKKTDQTQSDNGSVNSRPYPATVDELLKNADFYDGKTVVTCGSSFLYHLGSKQSGKIGEESDIGNHFTGLDIGDPDKLSMERMRCIYDTRLYTDESMAAIKAVYDATPDNRINNAMVIGTLRKKSTHPTIYLETLITPSKRLSLVKK